MLPRALAAFRQRHAPAEYRLLRRLARRAGYHLVKADYYSPIPDVDDIPPQVWSEPAPMPGLNWDLDAQVRLLEQELAPFLSELQAPAEPPGTTEGYYLHNAFFGPLDAEVLHAMVRRQRPARIVEIGSGFSTLVIAGAARLNEQDGAPATHEVIDPFPSELVNSVTERIELQLISANQVRADALAELRGGDVLFIDSTHAVKPGGEVSHLVLDVLPALEPGVLIHFHDFFRPFEYPRVLLEGFGVYWQEHHLLQAFLAFNQEFELLAANNALLRLRGERVCELVPSVRPGMEPSSLWLRRR